jgi:hypothetical protein
VIRKAKAEDIPRMVEILRDGANASVEADRLTFDDLTVRKTVFHCVTNARAWAAVAPAEGDVEGLLCGVAQPVYGCAVELEATDLWWVGTDRCSPRDKVHLMIAFTDWAKAHPKVARVQCGVTKIMGGDEGRAEKVLERLGMTRFGSVWRMDA